MMVQLNEIEESFDGKKKLLVQHVDQEASLFYPVMAKQLSFQHLLYLKLNLLPCLFKRCRLNEDGLSFIR